MEGFNFDLLTREAEQKRIAELEAGNERLRAAARYALEWTDNASGLTDSREMCDAMIGECERLLRSIREAEMDRTFGDGLEVEIALWRAVKEHGDLEVPDGAQTES